MPLRIIPEVYNREHFCALNLQQTYLKDKTDLFAVVNPLYISKTKKYIILVKLKLISFEYVT